MSIGYRPGDNRQMQPAHEVVAPDISRFESAGAAKDLAEMDTATQSLMQLMELRNLEAKTQNDPKLSPEQLNEKFPGLEKPFTEPKNYKVAEEIFKRNLERRKLQNVIDAGPQDFLQSAVNFGAAVIPHTYDPLEVGAGIATGFAFNAAAATTVGAVVARNTIAKTIFGAGQAIKTTGQVIARDVVEGAIGNIVTEPFTTMPLAEAEQREYGLKDAAFNATVGALGFAAVKGVGAKSIRYLRNLSDVKLRENERIASKQLSNDEKVDVKDPIEATVKAMDPPDAKTGYVHTDLNQVPNLSEVTFHAPKALVTDSIDADAALHSDFYGSGVYVTDNPAVADAAADAGFNGSKGSVVEVTLKPEAKVLNLDAKLIDEDFNTALKSAIEKSGFKDPGAVDVNIKEFFELLQDANLDKDMDEFFDVLAKEAMDRGIDGYRFVSDSVGGVARSPNNSLVIFNKDMINQGKVRTPPPGSAINPTAEKIREIREKQQSIQNHRDYDPEIDAKLNANIENPQIRDLKPSELEREAMVSVETAKEIEKLGLLDDEGKAEFKKLLEDEAMAPKLEEIAKQAITCVLGG